MKTESYIADMCLTVSNQKKLDDNLSNRVILISISVLSTYLQSSVHSTFHHSCASFCDAVPVSRLRLVTLSRFLARKHKISKNI